MRLDPDYERYLKPIEDILEMYHSWDNEGELTPSETFTKIVNTMIKIENQVHKEQS